MPKIKTKRKKYPKGWEIIEPTLSELDSKMRDAMNEPHEGKRNREALWPILRIHHQRSRYIFELFRKRTISKELYDFCLRENIADAMLIAKWKKPGYSRLCCLRCIQSSDQNYGATCICRVPSASLEEGRVVECVVCGCRGCATGECGDNPKKKKKKKKELDISTLPPALAAAEMTRRGIEAPPTTTKKKCCSSKHNCEEHIDP